MSIPYPNHQFAPLPEVRVSARDVAAPIGRPSGSRPAGPGFGRKVGRFLADLFAGGERRTVINELTMLSDRELSDIGISRSDISRVFDADFAAEHNARD